MTTQEIEFLKTLQPPPPHWQGMGALKYRYDPRDWDVRSLPGVSEALEAGIPDSIDLTKLIQGEILNQGATGACVAYSTSHVAALDDVLETNQWANIQAPLVYSRAGGTGQNGVDSRLVLQQAVEQGMPVVGGGVINTIASYAYVPQQPGVFTQTIKAALAAGYPMVLALLLPSDFGWQSGHGARTSGYHQICIIGYTADGYWIILNSWGSSWPGNGPHPGVGSILQSFCEQDNLQNGYCFAYTVTPKAVPNPTPIPIPTPIPTPTPDPPPPLQATVTGRAMAGATNGVWPKIGSVIPFGQDVALTVTRIDYDGTPTPDPQPNPNPNPQPDPNPQPQPDGGIQVLLTTKPSAFRNTVAVITYTADKQGHSFPCSVTGTVTGSLGTVPLPGATTHGTQLPAQWIIQRPAPWGEACQVTVSAFNGDATGSATKPG